MSGACGSHLIEPMNGVGNGSSEIVMSTIHDQSQRQSTSMGYAPLASVPISQADFEEALINLVIDEMLPFSFVESDSFRKYTNCEYDRGVYGALRNIFF